MEYHIEPPPPHSASCNVCQLVHVHISKCTRWYRNNITSASCSESQPPQMQVGYLCQLMEGKHHQYNLHSVKTILSTRIGVGSSNQTQLAQGHHLNADLALALPAFGCCITYSCPGWYWHCATCNGSVSNMKLNYHDIQLLRDHCQISIYSPTLVLSPNSQVMVLWASELYCSSRESKSCFAVHDAEMYIAWDQDSYGGDV